MRPVTHDMCEEQGEKGCVAVEMAVPVSPHHKISLSRPPQNREATALNHSSFNKYVLMLLRSVLIESHVHF